MNRLIIIVYDLEKLSYTVYWIYMIVLQRKFDFTSLCVTNAREEKERDGRFAIFWHPILIVFQRVGT